MICHTLWLGYGYFALYIKDEYYDDPLRTILQSNYCKLFHCTWTKEFIARTKLEWDLLIEKKEYQKRSFRKV
ncbi:hypothetical protein HYD54_01010 [Mycoplasmopsis bovis]|nr:hypothetical protein HYD54_01010 [Mycoplasmopsis bovis]